MVVADSACLFCVESIEEALQLTVTRVEALIREEVSELGRTNVVVPIRVNEQECAVEVHVDSFRQCLSVLFDLPFSLQKHTKHSLHARFGLWIEKLAHRHAFAHIEIGPPRDHMLELLSQWKYRISEAIEIYVAKTFIEALEHELDVVRRVVIEI